MWKQRCCDSISTGDFLQLHIIRTKPKCDCQKQITFTLKPFQLEGAGFRNTMNKICKGSQNAWDNFLKAAVKTPAPIFGIAVGVKGKNPQVSLATTNILNSLSGKRGYILTLHAWKRSRLANYVSLFQISLF